MPQPPSLVPSVWPHFDFGLLVVWLPYYSAGWSEHLPGFSGSDASMLSNAIYGVVLIVIVFTLPAGLASGLGRATERLVRITPAVTTSTSMSISTTSAAATTTAIPQELTA